MKNYKIIENRPELTEEQVMHGMNFHVVQAGLSVSAKISFLKLFSLKTLFFTGVAVVTIITGTFVYNRYYNSGSTKEGSGAIDPGKQFENVRAMESVTENINTTVTSQKSVANKKKSVKQDHTENSAEELAKQEAFKKSVEESLKLIESYRQRVINGESMSDLAIKYSEDPGSAENGGRYDNIALGMMVPEFENVAFRLKPNEVSEVFKTQYGFHFVQLIARRGNLIDLRHILVIPK
jgi:hypothetical protein